MVGLCMGVEWLSVVPQPPVRVRTAMARELAAQRGRKRFMAWRVLSIAVTVEQYPSAPAEGKSILPRHEAVPSMPPSMSARHQRRPERRKPASLPRWQVVAGVSLAAIALAA